MFKIEKNNIKKFTAYLMIIMILISAFSVSVLAIQRSTKASGSLRGYLADNNAPGNGGGWIAYGDSETSATASSIRATVSVTYNYSGDKIASGDSGTKTNTNKAYSTSSPTTPANSTFKRESSSHSATVNGVPYSVNLNY